jgi:hypothetical protein
MLPSGSLAAAEIEKAPVIVPAGTVGWTIGPNRPVNACGGQTTPLSASGGTI